MSDPSAASPQQRYSLRVKILIVALSILVTAASTVWVLSVISYRTGISRSNARLQAYKADQFLDFIDSQLELLEYLDLAGDPEYNRLAENSMRRFAYGMLRSPAELVLLVRSSGELVFDTLERADADTTAETVDAELAELVEEIFATGGGWFTIAYADSEYLGEAVRVGETDLGFFIGLARHEFYREQRQLTLQNIVALIVLTTGGGIAIAVVLRRLLQPLSDVTAAMREVALTKDFTRNLAIRDSDEIGILAAEFNQMTNELGAAYERLKIVANEEARLRAEVTDREYETLEVMGRATEYKDPETGRHIVRVGIYASLIAAQLGEDEEQQDLIRHAAPLHDVGKLGIPDAILLKPTGLDADEFRVMTEHTRIAHAILKDSQSKYLRTGAVIALTHHEHWDGSGYPNGIAGEEIPLVGRIVGLVDTFDALISRRPYKEPWMVHDVLEEIERLRGTQFDPAVVDAFFAVKETLLEVATDYADDYS
jgi:response regulator RpfG family c-di-GMP phosphodiesterase